MTKICLKRSSFFPPISTPFFALLGSFFPMGLIGRSIQILTTFSDFFIFFRSIYPYLAVSTPKNPFLPYFAVSKNPLFCKISIFFIFFYPNPFLFHFLNPNPEQSYKKNKNPHARQ